MVPIHSYVATCLARLRPIATDHKYNACALRIISPHPVGELGRNRGRDKVVETRSVIRN